MSDCWQRLADILNRLELAFCGPFIDAGTVDSAPGLFGLSNGSTTREAAVLGTEDGWVLLAHNSVGRLVPTAPSAAIVEHWQALADELNAMHAAGEGPTVQERGGLTGTRLAGVYGLDSSVCFTGDRWTIRDGNGDRTGP